MERVVSEIRKRVLQGSVWLIKLNCIRLYYILMLNMKLEKNIIQCITNSIQTPNELKVTFLEILFSFS